MPVEITILSGSRQGEQFYLDQNSIRVGDSHGDDLRFDVSQDPSAAGREVELHFEEDGWRIRNLGSRSALINHQSVDSGQPLRSGDIIRLSEDGPDFSFTVLRELPEGVKLGVPPAAVARSAPTGGTSPAATPAAAPERTVPTATVAAANETPVAAELVPTAEPAENPGARVAIWATIAAVAMVVIMMFWRWRDKEPPVGPDGSSGDVAFHAIPAQEVEEGQRLVISPRLQDEVEGVQFKLENALAGLDIDPDTGTISWIPTVDETTKYTLIVTALNKDGKRLGETPIVVTVKDVDLPPQVTPAVDHVVDPRRAEPFEYQIEAMDPEGAGTLTYRLAAGAPQGMKIDEQGRITWLPAVADQGQTYDVEVTVSDGNNSGSTRFKVNVLKPGPWDRAVASVSPAIYLLALEDPKAQAMFPFGTATAIKSNYLLSTASIGVELERKRQTGWKVWAVSPRDREQRELVEEIKIAAPYDQLKDTPEQQIYFDFALFRVADKLDDVAPLADEGGLAELEKGQKIGCLGIDLQGESLDRFTNITPAMYEGSIFLITNLSADGSKVGAPRLLHINGRPAWPRHEYDVDKTMAALFGSPILNERGEIVALYSDAAQFPKDDPLAKLDIHYAPVATLAAAFLADQGQELWVVPKLPPETNASGTKPGDPPAGTKPPDDLPSGEPAP